MPAYRQQLGKLGEEAAATYLIGRGFFLIAKNVSCSIGEIDLLMREGTTIVVIEVKSQRSLQYSDPIYKVDLRKQNKLRRLAEWVSLRYPNSIIRIDVVTVYVSNDTDQPLIRHYPNCITF